MSKDEAASALAAKRWSKTSSKKRTELAKAMNTSRWKDATPQERAAQGKRLAEARAAARKKAAKKTT